MTVTPLNGPGDLRVVCEGRTFYVWHSDNFEWSVMERGSTAPIVRRPSRSTAFRYVEEVSS